jgi:predicted MFS family arabinose efflux permease
VFGLIETSRFGFGHPLIWGTLCAGAVLLSIFVVLEWRSRSPMMPLALFRSRAFSGANLLTLFLYAALAGGLFFVPMNLMQVHGFTATQAGAAMIPSVLLLFLLSRWAGGLADRIGAGRLLVTGPAIAGLGFALFTWPGTGVSYWTGFFPGFVVLGFGMALTVAPLTTTVMGSVSREHSGVASGINNAVSETAGLLAVAAFGLVMSHAFHANLDRQLDSAKVRGEIRHAVSQEEAKLGAIEAPRGANAAEAAAVRQAVAESFVGGFRWVMGIAAALALLSIAWAWICIAGSPGTGGRKHSPPA